MATLNVPLTHGLTIGETTYTTAVVREPNSGDVIEANEESEKLVLVPTSENGQMVDIPHLVQSPTMVGVHVLRRQVLALKDANGESMSGPLELHELKQLHPEDLKALQVMAEKFDSLAAQAAKGADQRGRSDGSGQSAGPDADGAGGPVGLEG